jgi:cation diffusion facilitator CzcD-associated flavoprotein CzcO
MTTVTRDTPTVSTNGRGPARREVDVAIIGSGFAGLGMAIRLKQAGLDDFAVFERGEDVGGTWWFNSYPGCQCDVPSHLYSFSFALNPDWSRTYSKQAEIQAYLRDCAERFDVMGHIRFSTDVSAGEWDDELQRWRLQTTGGEVLARVVVAGFGPLSEPKTPDLPGLDRFKGATFHTAQWNHDVDLHDKRVAVLGTGASAIQVAPQLQPLVEQLHVFQRTPPWVVPHRDRPVTALERRLYRAVPALQRWVRGNVYAMRELLVPGLAFNPKLQRPIQRLAEAHIAKQVPDPELRARVTPDYTIGCKRILPSNDWYPALGQPNVELVTSGIREVREDGIVTGDGQEVALDAIIFATGFHVTDIPMAPAVRGRDGQSLADVWQGSPQAFRGTTVSGFPNAFIMLGPNTGLGHNSVVYMIESQINYVMDALRLMRERGIESVDVRPEVQDAFNERMQARMARSVWNTGGCSSWYLDANGRNSTIWPDFTWRYRLKMRRFDASAYVARVRDTQPAAAPVPS